jgi:hypothetical protein
LANAEFALSLERGACHRLGYVAAAERRGKRSFSRACEERVSGAVVSRADAGRTSGRPKRKPEQRLYWEHAPKKPFRYVAAKGPICGWEAVSSRLAGGATVKPRFTD